MRRIAALAAASLLSLSLSLPTFAHENHDHTHTSAQRPVQKHLSTYRDDTHALMTLKIDLQTWKTLFDEAMGSVKNAKLTVKTTETNNADETSEDTEAPSEATEVTETREADSSEDLLKMFNEFNQEMKDQTGVDLFWDVLLNMGTHLSAGYRAFPNRAGDLLFQLDVRSGEKANEVLNKVFTQLQADGEDNAKMVKEQFGPKTLYTFVLDENEAVYQRLSLAVHDNTLIATLGPDAHQLKTMLYLGQVHPQDSAFRLTNTPYFKPVEKALHENPLWLYSDLNSVMELANLVREEIDIDSSDLDILAEVIPLVRGVGMGVNYKRNQLTFQGIAAHDMAHLSDFQKAYLTALKAPSESKNAVMNRLLGPSPLVFAGEKLGLALDKPFPLDPEKVARSEMLSVLDEMSYRKLLPKFLSMDLDQDVLPYIDGNYGFSVVEIPGKDTPQSVLVLGLKQGQGNNFEKVLQDKLNIDLKELMSDDEAPPIRLVPHGNYAGVSTYRFSGPFDGDEEMKKIIFPVAAQTGDVLLIGQTEAALQAALDHKDFTNPALSDWMQKTDTRQAANLFFMDITQLIDWATRYGLVDKEDEDIQAVGKSLRSIYSATYPTADAFEGKLVLDVDFSGIPFEKLTQLFAGELGDDAIDVDIEEATPVDDETMEEDTDATMEEDSSDSMDEDAETVEEDSDSMEEDAETVEEDSDSMEEDSDASSAEEATDESADE
jgi:hypothetical protein